MDCLLLQNREILFATDVNEKQFGNELFGVLIKGSDDLILDIDPRQVELVNGIGSIGVPTHRKKIYDTWTERGYRFTNVIHPSAIVGRDVEIEAGVQVMAGAVVQASARLAINSIVNSSANVDHDCQIGAHCHIAPMAALSGAVTVNCCSHVGTAAAVIQGITIGERCVVGAGATVIENLPDDSVVVGTPAKPIRKS